MDCSPVILGMPHALEEGEFAEVANAFHFFVTVLELKQFFTLEMLLSTLMLSHS